MKKILLSLFVAATISFATKAQTPLTTAVDFTATDIHGTTHNLFTYLADGKYVCLEFFYDS
jgi:hypothetical protein